MTDSSPTVIDEALVATAAAGDAPSVGHALADLGSGTRVGRYVVLSKLGAGGMGVVFAAYDPELDRKVALKLLHPRLAADTDTVATSEARARLVREAQALAKLNHPHIVAIHDVGEHRGAVWLAMEHIEGETLAAWSKRQRRSWREVLAVMTPAARGLSAAHDAGLVHRDIKPDNIMLGADGRVRVMDLGLARALGDEARAAPVAPLAATAAAGDLGVLAAQVTRAGALMGTPAYMSPEQLRGDVADVRTDVFSFCVMSWEALMGVRPFAGETLVELAANVLAGRLGAVPRDSHSRRVPGWLRRVCVQGLAVEPERRFASIHALLDALSRGQARSRARKWLVGAASVAALGGSAALYQRHDGAARLAACEEAGAGIDAVWGEEARIRVREGIVTTGLSYAPVTADNVMPLLDAHAEAWREHRAEACVMADIEQTLDAEQLDRAVWCLDERRMELAALVAELSRADEQVVQKAVTAAASLPPVSPCSDRQVLAALPAPPPTERRGSADAVRTTLSRARALLLAGKYPEGLERASTALAEADALGWPPMTAAARHLQGELLGRTGAFAEGEPAMVEAHLEASKVRAWNVAALAAIGLVFNVGYRQARHAEGRVWAGHAEVAIGLAGDPMGLLEATRLNALAAIHQASGAYAEAKVASEWALSIREEALGPEHPDVAVSANNLALIEREMGAYAEAKVLHQRALAIREKALGPTHPDVAHSLNNLAVVHVDTGAHAEAKALYQRALDIRKEALGPTHPDVAQSLNNLAVVHVAMGEYVEARAIHRRALEIREKALGPEHPEVAQSLNNLAKVAGDMGEHAEARALYQRALEIREKALGPEHPDVAASLNNLATIDNATGAYAEAKALHERALAIREKALGPEHPDVAASLNNLATVRNRMGEHAEAKALHERALAIREKVLGPAHLKVAQSLFNLADVHQRMGEHAEARALYERALEIWEQALGPEHPDVALALGGLGGLALEQDRPAEALPRLERAVAIYDASEGVQTGELDSRLRLARALALTGGDRTRMLAEARKAADGFREAGMKELAAAEGFLAEHGGTP